MTDLSVVIVNYNAGRFLLDCLDSLHRQVFSGTWQAIVVDNASSDGSLARARERFPAVATVAHADNVGFARGVNAGIARADGRYLFLLNPDTVLAPDVFAEMVTFMDAHPEVGIGGPRVVNPDGSLQAACRREIPTPAVALAHFFRLGRVIPRRWNVPEYKITRRDPQVPAEVGAVSGSCMVVRRATLEAVGAFDESFFMYGEDLDYCHRVRLAGAKVYYHPKAVVVHHGGVSSATNRQRAEREFYRAMWLFYRKHYAPASHPLTNKMVYLGIAGLDRLARVGSLVHLKRRPTAV